MKIYLNFKNFLKSMEPNIAFRGVISERLIFKGLTPFKKEGK